MIHADTSFCKRMLLAFICGVGLLLAPEAGAEQAGFDEALRLYDAGRYADARPLLEAAVAAGKTDGITHYRLYFCQRAAGDPVQQQTLAVARGMLEKELDAAKRFDVAFYLASTYGSLGLTEQVKRLASETTARFEAGEIPAPTSAIEQFRLGKLYADQGDEAGTARWFAEATEGFAASSENRFGTYLQWSTRWLGQRAIDDERYEQAAKYFTHVAAAGSPTEEDLQNLGLSSLIVGRYRQAIDAFNRALRMNPAGGNDYRYGSGLAKLAQRTPDLPISPDGERSWEKIDRGELEELMRAGGQKVREVREEIDAAEKPSGESLAAFQARLDEARPLFVAAALEYTRRGLSLREASFFGGYAPLIFLGHEWSANRVTGPRRWTAQEFAEYRKRMLAESEATKRKASKQDDEK